MRGEIKAEVEKNDSPWRVGSLGIKSGGWKEVKRKCARGDPWRSDT